MTLEVNFSERARSAPRMALAWSRTCCWKLSIRSSSGGHEHIPYGSQRCCQSFLSFSLGRVRSWHDRQLIAWPGRRLTIRAVPQPGTSARPIAHPQGRVELADVAVRILPRRLADGDRQVVPGRLLRRDDQGIQVGRQPPLDQAQVADVAEVNREQLRRDPRRDLGQPILEEVARPEDHLLDPIDRQVVVRRQLAPPRSYRPVRKGSSPVRKIRVLGSTPNVCIGAKNGLGSSTSTLPV